MSPTSLSNANIYNPNVNYAQQYQDAANQVTGAQSNLQNYQQNMTDPSQMYGQDLTNAQNMYGFDPKALGAANQNLARTQTVMANLPQAVQQQGAYYGTTAGSEANNYAQQEGNLQPVLAGQTNAVNSYQNELAATQQQANQQATLGLQGQQLHVQALQDAVANALGFQSTSQAEQAGYGQYVTNVAQAQAAQEAASAQMEQANTAAAQLRQQANVGTTLQSYLNSLSTPATQGTSAAYAPAANNGQAGAGYGLAGMSLGGGLGGALGGALGPFGSELGSLLGSYGGYQAAPNIRDILGQASNGAGDIGQYLRGLL